MLKLRHNRFKSHTTTRRRGRSGMGWRSHHLSLWPFRSKLGGLTPSNRRHTDGTHDGEMNRLEIGDRGMANDPRDSKRKDKLITGCCILINIYKGKNEMRGKIYSKILNEGKQKSSTRLSNKVIVRQGMKNKCHHHIQEPRTFCKAQV